MGGKRRKVKEKKEEPSSSVFPMLHLFLIFFLDSILLQKRAYSSKASQFILSSLTLIRQIEICSLHNCSCSPFTQGKLCTSDASFSLQRTTGATTELQLLFLSKQNWFSMHQKSSDACTWWFWQYTDRCCAFFFLCVLHQNAVCSLGNLCRPAVS